MPAAFDTMTGEPNNGPTDVELSQASPNRVIASLRPADRSVICPHLKLRVMNVAELIASTGDTIQGMFFPLAGLISVVTRLSGGQSVETAIVGREGCLGFIEAVGSGIAFSESIVQHDLRTLFLSLAELRRIARERPDTLHRLHLGAECLVAHSQQSVACQSHHQLHPRLCRWLASAHDRSGERVLHFTQQFLAEMLGVQRTTVTEIATDLQERGWIRYARGRIQLNDVDALRAHACECYESVRQHEARVWAEGQAAA